MNISVYIDGKIADIDESLSIIMQKEFEDDENNIVTEIEYSYDISFPTSDNNKQIFGYTDAFDVPNKFSRLYDAQLYVNDVLILDGKVKLSEINTEEYKGNIYNPSTVSITDILGDLNLDEITPHMKPMNNMTDYAECNNYVMGLSTTEIPKAEYRDKHICYPFILWNLPYNDTETAESKNYDFYTQDLSYSGCTLDYEMITPAFNVTSVIKDIFSTFDLNVTGNIFEDYKFDNLYQTLQYSYSDFVEGRNTPYYVSFSCSYDNYNTALNRPSTTLQSATVWSEDDWDEGREGHYWSGAFECGVDNPLVCENSSISIKSNTYNMLKKGTETDAYSLTVPRSGWYRIVTKGNMKYPLKSFNGSSKTYESVGGYKGSGEECHLGQRPFEFQIKKGYPGENPKLYSIFGTLPCQPTNFKENYTTKFDGKNTYIRCNVPERQRYYPKNGGTTLIKEFSDFPISDFLCGARLGGAWANADLWYGNYYGGYKSALRHSYMLPLMALPRTTRPTLKDIEEDKYFQISNANTNSTYEYANSTAVAMVREDSYSNFGGYNVVNSEYTSWDTTSNPQKKTYQGIGTSSASASSDTAGTWSIDTVVYLEKGDTINVEVVMPIVRYYNSKSGSLFSHSKIYGIEDRVVRTQVNFDFEMGFVNSNKEWEPSSSSPIPSMDEIRGDKSVNVNQFLPKIKCNDYLNNFLQTFNLKLTSVNKNTYSIDSVITDKIMGNIISLEDYCNVKDAAFKALDLPSTRQLTWKFDKAETGYADGNKSPYKTEEYPWYESGYTGEITITNETNTSGSVSKKESQWSYNWYKTINFINSTDGLSVKKADIPVISDASMWKRESTYSNSNSSVLETSKTMRLFMLGVDESTKMYKYAAIPYDKTVKLIGGSLSLPRTTVDYKICKLVIPTNVIKTVSIDSEKYYYLDYSDLVHKYKNAKTLTDVFFNLKVLSGYEVDVPVILPNDIYSEIKAGTLFKLNDGIYSISKIEGHDTSEYDKATLTLLTLT